MYKLGPLGILLIIPMFLSLYFCGKAEKRRQMRRVREMLEEQLARQLAVKHKQMIRDEIMKGLKAGAEPSWV